MRVSVVIPTYNSAPLVVEAVESVLVQTRPADEIIVVDDGSTDDTAGQLSRFGPPVRVIRKENGGVSSARNRGVAEATGDLIAFLDADDVWHPRKLEIQLAILEARSDLGLLGTRTYAWPGPCYPEVGNAGELVPVAVPLDELVVRNAFTASSVIVRRGILEVVGDFDTEQFGTEDYDLWLRVAQHTTVANAPVALTGYRVATVGSLSKNAVRMESGMRLILRKLEKAGVFRRRPLLRRKVWGYFRCSCGYMHYKAGNRWRALGLLTLSLLGYPLPYPRREVYYKLGRLRLLAGALYNKVYPSTALMQ